MIPSGPTPPSFSLQRSASVLDIWRSTVLRNLDASVPEHSSEQDSVAPLPCPSLALSSSPSHPETCHALGVTTCPSATLLKVSGRWGVLSHPPPLRLRSVPCSSDTRKAPGWDPRLLTAQHDWSIPPPLNPPSSPNTPCASAAPSPNSPCGLDGVPEPLAHGAHVDGGQLGGKVLPALHVGSCLV